MWLLGTLVACGPGEVASGGGAASGTSAGGETGSTTESVPAGSTTSGSEPADSTSGSSSTSGAESSTGAPSNPPPPGGLGDWGWGYVRLGTDARYVKLADFDLDGDLDVYASSWAEGPRNRIQLLLNDGNGARFTPSFDEVLRARLEGLVGDFNGDGLPDVATAEDTTGASLRMLYGDGFGGFDGPQTVELFDTLFFYFGPVVFDANHDAYADFLLTRGCCEEDATVAEGTADGSFSFTTHVSSPWGFFNRVIVIDLDGDGWDDLVATGTGNSIPEFLALATYFGGPSGLVQGQSFTEVGDGIVEGGNLVAVDYDGDGGRDIVVPTVNGLSVLSVAEDGALSDPVLHPHGLEWWPQFVAAIELEAGDTSPSFVLSRRHLPAFREPWTHLSALLQPDQAAAELDLQGRVVASGDLDGDERNDLVVVEGGELQGEVGIWLSRG